MKKKISLLLLVILMIPIVALFGCNETVSYQISVFSSWMNSGYVSGGGTYKEGDTAALQATAFGDNTFVCWLFQGSKLLDSNNDGYTIETSTNSKTSTLKFKSSKENQGRYTAVFSEENLPYVKLDSIKIFDSSSSAIESLDYLTIWQDVQGLPCFNQEAVALENNTCKFSQIKQVMELKALETKEVTISTRFDNISYEFVTGINLAENISETECQDYSYSTTYNDGIYVIKINFDDYEMLVEYRALDYDAKHLNEKTA